MSWLPPRSDFSTASVSTGALATILVVGLVLRIAWALMIPVDPISDSIGYDTFARNLTEHGVYGWTPTEPHAYWPPGTSMLYAAVYAVFGIDHANIVVLNLLLSMVLLVCTARVACRYYGESVAIYAAALLAVWPTLVMYTTILASELPYLTFTIAALDAWTSRSGNVLTRGIVAGLLIGFASLIRPLALLLPFIFAGCLVIQGGLERRAFSQQLRTGIVALICMACIIGPWSYRNYQLYEEPILISTNGGITLWMGVAPGTDGRFMGLPDDVQGLPDNEISRILNDRAIGYIKEDPVRFLVLVPKKLFLLWGNESVGAGWNSVGITETFGETTYVVMKRFTQLTWAGIFCIAFLGLIDFARTRGFWAIVASPFVLTIAYHSAVHSVLVAQERYHVGFAAQVAVGFAFGILALQRLRSTGRLGVAGIG